jgi:hypothetical protein
MNFRLLFSTLLLGILVLSACKHRHGTKATDAIPVSVQSPDVLIDSLYNGKTDLVTVDSVKLVPGDQLMVFVSFSGGCENHVFDLIWKKEILKSLPLQLPLYIRHDAKGDKCRSIQTAALSFGILALRQPNAKSVKLTIGTHQVIYKY